MPNRREFLKETAVIPVAGMLPVMGRSVGCPNGNVQTETDLERLRRLCLAGLSGRYEQGCFPSARRRLDHELAILDRLGRVGEFLAVGEIAQFAREERIPLRLKGSGCSSMIPYLLGFSDVDPVEYYLFFERFRDPHERWAPPFVVQVDAAHRDRIRCIASLGYGKDFVERTIDFIPATTWEKVPWLVVESLRRKHGRAIDLRRVPLDDDQTFRLIRRGDTEGISGLQHDGMRHLLLLLGPRNIEALTVIMTLYSLSIERGDLVEEYLRRANQREFPVWEIPDILETFAATRGMILYQEQIMMLLDKVGGISPGDGFDFIKAVFKKKATAIAQYRKSFFRHALRNSIDAGCAERLFDQITEAAGYATCKAGAVAEAVAAYRSAYLKAHHRTEFDEVLSTLQSTT